jgi:hypothetical protein
MTNRICLILVSLAAMSGLMFAQESRTALPKDWHPSPAPKVKQSLERPAVVDPSTTACSASFSGGSGDTATAFCVTANGNIPQFSRAGEEMIDVGTVDEGYGICDFTSDTPYYDYAWEDSGNWLPATFTSTATSATSTRLTSDGIWKIANVITYTKPTTTSAGKATVKMVITNLTGVTRDAYVLRHADVDADGDISDNDFDWTINTVTGQYTVAGTDSFGYGLQLVNQTFNSAIDHNEYALNTFSGPNPCSPFGTVATQPFHGDGSEMSLYFAAFGPHKSQTFTVAYVPE